MLAAWQPATALSLALMALGALAPQGAGAQSRDEGRRTTIYRCDGGGAPVFSDTEQRCAGQTVATNPAPSPKPIIGPTTQRLTLNGPPCPLPVTDPQGPAWSTLRVCYDAALLQQPDHKVGEQQLAGMLMGQCERETQALAQGKDHAEPLGPVAGAAKRPRRRFGAGAAGGRGPRRQPQPPQRPDGAPAVRGPGGRSPQRHPHPAGRPALRAQGRQLLAGPAGHSPESPARPLRAPGLRSPATARAQRRKASYPVFRISAPTTTMNTPRTKPAPWRRARRVPSRLPAMLA